MHKDFEFDTPTANGYHFVLSIPHINEWAFRIFIVKDNKGYIIL